MEICLIIEETFISNEPPHRFFFNPLYYLPKLRKHMQIDLNQPWVTSRENKAEKRRGEMCPIKSARFNCPYGVKLDEGDIRGQLEVGISAHIKG